MNLLPDSYLATVARSVGVEPMFIDDALQEMKLAIWRAPHVNVRVVAKREAIDFQRFLTHKGHLQPEWLDQEMQAPSSDWCLISDECLDLQRAWGRLPPHQQRALVKQVTGYKTTRSEQSMAAQGRARLRQL